MTVEILPVVVIGAGPVGLAAAAHLVERGLTPIVLEAGCGVGTGVREWAHVRLFSPWRYMVDPAAEKILTGAGWYSPEPGSYPTGGEFVDRYLVPLSQTAAIQPHLRFGARVTAVSREAHDKMKTGGRAEAPFVVRVEGSDGTEEEIRARAVIDASGTLRTPNPLGAAGLPALGECALADRIFYGIPDVLGSMSSRYGGRRVLVVGSGHSAFNVLLDLVGLAERKPATSIFWGVRRDDVDGALGGGAQDQLAQRGKLGERVRKALTSGMITVYSGFHVDRLTKSANGMTVHDDGRELPPVDEIIVTTGFRPDLTLLRELRLSLDATVESPSALAPLIDPNVHSCGTVPPHGVEELSHPDEPGLYIVGMKSYGRAPTFLALTGYEQVRSVVAALAGDWDAARDVRLVLPETGVCATDRTDAPRCGSEREVQSFAAAPSSFSTITTSRH